MSTTYASMCLSVALLITFSLRSASAQFQQGVTLTVVHSNDVHARYLETSRYGSACSVNDTIAKKCFGGFSRTYYKVNEINATHPNVLYLSAGDYFQGTVWYTFLKWKVLAEYLNQFHLTAMALGNHEFDDRVEGLVPFLKNVSFPILSCNLNATSEPRMLGKFKKSIVVSYQGWKVGIIGYTIKDTGDLSQPGKNITFENEFTAVSAEATRLHAVEHVKIIIAVGHAGYDVDIKLAEVPYVDIIVGGHSHTFLYHGTPLPDVELPLGDYPTVVTENGRTILVVQAFWFGKYLGYLNVTFDGNGEVSSWAGNPILLNSSVPQDSVMEASLQKIAVDVDALSKEVVGETKIYLNGTDKRSCRLVECNLGSLIADAMVESTSRLAENSPWRQTKLAILHGGSVRASIDNANGGVITLEHILTVLPYQNTVDFMEIDGKTLRQIFEWSATGYDVTGNSSEGKFLQVSGIRVTYDMTQIDGKRVKSLAALGPLNCGVVLHKPVNDTELYKVAVPTFLLGGGDGYNMIQGAIVDFRSSGTLDSDVMLDYIKKHTPIDEIRSKRIKILK